MEEFPSNSIQPSGPTSPKVRRPIPSDDTPEVQSPAQGEKKVIRKVVTGKAIKKKKSLGSRFREAIGGKDGQNLPDFLMYEVLGPAFREMVVDAAIQGVERLAYGEARQSSRRTANHRGPVGSSSHISYNRYSARPVETRPPMSARGRGSHDFGEIELETMAEGHEVLSMMDELVHRYGTCAVSELYEMLGLESSFTDEKYGWTDLRGADVRRTRHGTYALILPRTEPIG